MISNAYAIRGKYEKKLECMEKSFQISYLQICDVENEGMPRRELCHARDSGAVAIAPLVRRSAAFYFADHLVILRITLLQRRNNRPASSTLCALNAPEHLSSVVIADGRRPT